MDINIYDVPYNNWGMDDLDTINDQIPCIGYVDKSYVDREVNSISGMIRHHGYETVLDEMDIEQIEQYVRNKKLKRITGNIKNK